MSFRHILLGFAVLSLGGWYALAHNVTKVEKLTAQQLAERIKAAADEVNGPQPQPFNSWLRLEKVEAGPDWITFDLTANRSDLPSECVQAAGDDASVSITNSCITRKTLRSFYCKYDAFRKLPTPNGFINSITVAYQLKVSDDAHRGTQEGQFPFESCKGFPES